MQLQFSLAVTDRLHETLLVRGEPMDALEAAGLLTACPECPPRLCMYILDMVVRKDHRFCWSTTPVEPLQADTVRGASTGPRISLRRWASYDPDLIDVPFVALDIETTGARAGMGKITEIGAVRIEGFREVGRFSTLVNPLRSIPRMITKITGITQDMVADAPRIDEVIPELLPLLKGAVVVGHNASFDVGFLNYELRRLKSCELGDGAIDTLPLARALAPGLPNYRLRTVAEALGSPVTACHRALADAEATGHVFVTLMKRLREQGVSRLSEARLYMVPSSRPAIEKLRLTRNIPCSPGAYWFTDADGRVTFVGWADQMRPKIRAHFVSHSPTRRMRKAIRTVERIEWEETYTTLEAVVREQELTLEHRPPCNQHSGRPESYVYLKVRDTGPGLRLYVSNRPTKNLAISTQEGETREGRRNHYPILLGPFRGRSRLTRALGLLQRCYPIRLCSRQTDTKPCSRGQVGECLAPCSDDPAALQAHDTLVQDLVGWLAGGCSPLLPDPTKSAGHLARQLTRRGRHEEARQIRKACGDLLNIRRSYAALVEACSLRFAVLWPLSTNGDGAALRLNVVWEGRMREPVSLRPQDLQQTLDATLAGYPMVCGDNEDNTEKPRNPRIIAVRQDELDLLLTTRHWLKEIAGPATVVTLAGPTKMHMTEWRYRLLTEATRMLGEQPLPTG